MKKILILLTLISTITIIPLLGLTEYNTKGEPREAIVAVSMIESGNWILPTSGGGDMAYKPPFFHWCIAAASSVAGEVSEFTSRLPSGLALVVMAVASCLFFLRGREIDGNPEAFDKTKRADMLLAGILSPLVLLTNFETHRAAFACRVDMVLTCCMVIALYALYHLVLTLKEGRENNANYRRSLTANIIVAVLMLSLGTLTKGPVALVLPCLVAWLFALTQGAKPVKITLQFAAIGIAALILPVAWYVAAYQQGGDTFLNLVMEENLGRLMGKMSYESHVNPWPYNVMTVFMGMMPYSLLCLFALPLLPWKKIKIGITKLSWYKMLLKKIGAFDMFCILSIAVIFLFYCIPASKRSVYLLPIYPFLAYYVARLMVWLFYAKKKAINVYIYIIIGVGAILSTVFIILHSGLINVTPEMFHGKHAAENYAYALALTSTSINVFQWFAVLLPLYYAVRTIYSYVKRKDKTADATPFVGTMATILIFFALDTTIQPLVLNTKSNRADAEKIEQLVPEGKIYSYCSVEMMRFFAINYYLGDRVQPYCLSDRELAIAASIVKKGDATVERPEEFFILIPDKDYEEFAAKFPGMSLTPIYQSSKKGCDINDRFKLYKSR